jgi:hypothetical protein
MMGLDKLAQRSQQIHTYLAVQDEERLRARLHRLRAAQSGDHAVDNANE